jgi:type VI secretion system protein ImpF
MAIHADQLLVPSVLDRLLDDDPTVSREAMRSRSQILREMKLSVHRDLENLLNTRRRCLPVPADLKELGKSLVSYGIPDVSGANLGASEARERLVRSLETILRAFEPRFHTVRVQLVDNVDQIDRTLRFRIDALLHADPAPEPIVFDSALEPGTGAFRIKGVGG